VAKDSLARAVAELKAIGLLLQAGGELQSVASLVAGETVKGSWWSHPRAQAIFDTLNRLEEHEDVLFARLISGKVTLVHRRLWKSLIPIALARESWQTRGLSQPAKFLLDKADNEGSFSTDDLDWPARFKSKKPGDIVRELETRLLLHAEEFHTQSGAHAKLIENWEHWRKRTRFRDKLDQTEEAKRTFEEVLRDLNKAHRAKARLPWQEK
jgi:hypothetical protein